MQELDSLSEANNNDNENMSVFSRADMVCYLWQQK